jgi:catechol 2,3-dioxygenase-like lactoylglutathione lyase family enzyme
MQPKRLTPILNVSNLQESFAWFEKLGWEKAWAWGEPEDLAVCAPVHCEIFLCEGAQGGRGKSAVTVTFGPNDNDAADKGVWMSIWVDDVDEIHQRCVAQGLEVTWPPTDMPWNVREMHVPLIPTATCFSHQQGIEE